MTTNFDSNSATTWTISSDDTAWSGTITTENYSSSGNIINGSSGTVPLVNGDATWASWPYTIEPTEEDYKTAIKLLHDPEFDLGKVMLEMVARFLARNKFKPEVFKDPAIQKALNPGNEK